MTNPKLPKAIIFDWDNTLVDTWPLIQMAIDDTMNKMGREPWGLEKVKNTVGKSMRESFPAIFGHSWEEAGEIYKNHYHSNNLANLVFLPGALEIINAVNEMGIILFVVSNKVGNTLRKEVNSLGVKDKFFSIIGATDAKYDKPSKEPVYLAIEGSDLDPEKDLIWFIGDTIIDIECAHNSGCQPILYGHSESISQNFLDTAKNSPNKPLLQFFSHKEILDYLQKLSAEK
jgi:phosphoglycolate phosphatase